MEKIISIIIPSFNMEDYLPRCIDSLLIPDLGKVEILVINDGSTDRTSAIAHAYQRRYPGSVTVIDKENGNYGSCINVALRQAAGKYVKILDADDFFSTEDFQTYVRKLETIEADTILTNFTVRNHQDLSAAALHDFVLPAEKTVALSSIMKLTAVPWMHSITYRRRLLTDINYRQTEGISYSDNEWCFLPLGMSHTFYYLPLNIYQYVIGREGQTVSPESMKKDNSHFLILTESLILTLERAKPRLNPEQLSFLNRSLCGIYWYVATRVIRWCDPEMIDEFKAYDQSLRFTHKDYYTQFGNYHPHTLWPIILKWRQSGYRIGYRVPIVLRIINTIHFRLLRAVKTRRFFTPN